MALLAMLQRCETGSRQYQVGGTGDKMVVEEEFWWSLGEKVICYKGLLKLVVLSRLASPMEHGSGRKAESLFLAQEATDVISMDGLYQG